jgi:hypothetical protein
LCVGKFEISKSLSTGRAAAKSPGSKLRITGHEKVLCLASRTVDNLRLDVTRLSDRKADQAYIADE